MQLSISKSKGINFIQPWILFFVLSRSYLRNMSCCIHFLIEHPIPDKPNTTKYLREVFFLLFVRIKAVFVGFKMHWMIFFHIHIIYENCQLSSIHLLLLEVGEFCLVEVKFFMASYYFFKNFFKFELCFIINLAGYEKVINF